MTLLPIARVVVSCDCGKPGSEFPWGKWSMEDVFCWMVKRVMPVIAIVAANFYDVSNIWDLCCSWHDRKGVTLSQKSWSLSVLQCR